MKALLRRSAIARDRPRPAPAWRSLFDPSACSERRFILLLISVGLLTRLAWILLVQPSPVSDFRWYFDHAVALSGGGGYRTDGIPTAYFPVGYPALLAAVFLVLGPSARVGMLANVVLSVAFLPIFYCFAGRLLNDCFARRISAVLVCLLPEQVAYCSLLSDSCLFQALLYAGGLLLISAAARRSIASGILIGLGALVRPYALALPLFVWLGSLRGDRNATTAREGPVSVASMPPPGSPASGRGTSPEPALPLANSPEPTPPRDLPGAGASTPATPIRGSRVFGFSASGISLRGLGVVYLVATIVLGPWLARNWAVFGEPTFVSTNGGINLLIGNGPGATGGYTGRPLAPLPPGLSEVERDGRALRLALSHVFRHPLQTLKLAPRKIVLGFGDGSQALRWNLKGLGQDARPGHRLLAVAGMGAFQLYHLGLLIGCGAYFVRRRFRRGILAPPPPLA